MLSWGAVYYRTGRDGEPPTEQRSRIPVSCPICGAHTNAPVIAFLVTPQSDFIRLPTMDMSLPNYLLQCTRCNGPLLMMWPNDRDMVGLGVTAHQVILPLPTDAFGADQFAINWVPNAIYEDIRQAELSAAAGAYYGAGLLLRRACQSICREKNIPENGGLRSQIDELAAQRIITEHLAEMAHDIRVIGNELAHPDPNTPSVITDEDVGLAYEFLTQLVRAIYVDPQRAAKLKADLNKRGVR
jgi:hypothetical protein